MPHGPRGTTAAGGESRELHQVRELLAGQRSSRLGAQRRASVDLPRDIAVRAPTAGEHGSSRLREAAAAQIARLVVVPVGPALPANLLLRAERSTFCRAGATGAAVPADRIETARVGKGGGR